MNHAFQEIFPKSIKLEFKSDFPKLKNIIHDQEKKKGRR